MALNRTDFVKNTVPGQTAQTDTGRQLSPAIWARCPRDSYLEDPTLGFFDFDDFHNLPFVAIGAEGAQGRYKRFGDTGNTVTKAYSNTGGAANATQLVPGGFLQLAIDSDDDACALADSYGSAFLSGLTTNSGKLWFEACYLQNGGVATGTGSVQGDAIPTNCANVFVGLAEVGTVALSTTAPWLDTGATATTASMLGFYIGEDGLGVVNSGYSDRGAAFTAVSTSEPGTMTAWVPKKLGLTYDPNDTVKALRFFVNNVELTTGMTNSQLAALTYIDVNALGRMIATSADSAGATFKAGLKWWSIAVEYPTNL